MGKYIVQLSKQALRDLKAIKKSGRKLDMEKVQTFLIELEDHPRTGSVTLLQSLGHYNDK